MGGIQINREGIWTQMSERERERSVKKKSVGLTSHSAGSISGRACSSQCLWNGTAPSRPQQPWRKDRGGLQGERNTRRRIQPQITRQQLLHSGVSACFVAHGDKHKWHRCCGVTDYSLFTCASIPKWICYSLCIKAGAVWDNSTFIGKTRKRIVGVWRKQP